MVARWAALIETDLLAMGVDVLDWHRGTLNGHGGLKLSSRRLLTLLEWLPDTSAFKTHAERDGGYSLDRLIAAETHNEIARLRASYHIVNGGEDAAYEPHTFTDPVIARMRDELEEAQDVERGDASEDFYADMGWT